MDEQLNKEISSYVTTREAAEISGYSIDYLRILAARNKIRVIRLSRQILFYKPDLLKYVNEQKGTDR